MKNTTNRPGKLEVTIGVNVDDESLDCGEVVIHGARTTVWSDGVITSTTSDFVPIEAEEK